MKHVKIILDEVEPCYYRAGSARAEIQFPMGSALGGGGGEGGLSFANFPHYIAFLGIIFKYMS